MNLVATISGRVLKINEPNFLESGNAVVSMRVSVAAARKKREDEQYNPSEIVEVEFWGTGLVNTVVDLFKDGMSITVIGKLKGVDTYLRKDGTPGATARFIAEHVAWPAKSNGNGNGGSVAKTVEEPDHVASVDMPF